MLVSRNVPKKGILSGGTTRCFEGLNRSLLALNARQNIVNSALPKLLIQDLQARLESGDEKQAKYTFTGEIS